MEISYFGQSCFLLRGKKAIVLTDPYSSEIGLKLPPISADIVTVSHDHFDHNNFTSIQGKARPEPFLVSGPGEYEILGVSIFGISVYHDDAGGTKRGKNTIYVVSMDGIRLAHLGDLGHLLSDEQLEAVNGVDILFVPVGGDYTIDAQKAVEVVNQIEPVVVIPMHYKLPGIKIELAQVHDFLKEMGMTEAKPEDKLVISSEKLPGEREVIVLNAKS